MKKILLLCAAVIFLTACGDSQGRNAVGMKGRVESVKDSTFSAAQSGAVATKLLHVTVHRFNPDGQEVKYERYEDGELHIAREYVYDGKMLICESSWDNYGGRRIDTLIEIQGDTQIWESKVKGLGPYWDETTQYEKDVSDTYSRTTKPDYGTRIEEEWYDADGNVIESKMTINNKLIDWVKSEFQDGNEIKKEYLKGIFEQSVMTFSYSDYDDKGNWTKEIYYFDGKPKTITKREIKYVD